MEGRDGTSGIDGAVSSLAELAKNGTNGYSFSASRWERKETDYRSKDPGLDDFGRESVNGRTRCEPITQGIELMKAKN